MPPSTAAQNTLYGRLDLPRWQNTALPPLYLTIPEDDKGGHALDLVGRRYSRIPVDVHFQDRNGITQFILQLF